MLIFIQQMINIQSAKNHYLSFAMNFTTEIILKKSSINKYPFQ